MPGGTEGNQKNTNQDSRWAVVMYRHSPPNAAVTIWNIKCKSNFVQVGTECTYGQLYVYVQRALEVEHLSLREHCEGNLEGGSFTGDPGGCVKEGSGDRHLSP